MVEFHYYYKDGNGFSLDGRKRYDGTVTEKDISEIVRALDDGEYFIASQVGLPDIQPKMRGFPSDADHVWCRFGDFNTFVEDDPNYEQPPISELLDAFRKAKVDGWDIDGAMKRLGLKA